MSTAKAWEGVLSFPVPGRSIKPRRSGVTMVIDKGMGLEATRGFLSLAADCVDFIKLGFGTSAFYDADLLRAKVRLIKKCGVHVLPGGTFLEAAEMQGSAERFLERAESLGFDYVEVSDGTLPIPPRRRRQIIGEAKELGLRVVSEVGKKHPDDREPLDVQCRQVEADLRAGVDFVVVEARESGTGVGIYGADGEVKESFLETIARSAPPDRLLWEAPLKKQQEALISRFGVNVNLGNVAPDEALALEALRVGLRGDTLRQVVRVGTVHE